MKSTSLSDTFPLSPMQQGMLFHYLKDPHSGVDIEQIVIHLREAISVERMEKAWQWLVQRHDILRARFLWDGDETRQEIAPRVMVPFVVEDGRGLGEDARREKLKIFLQADRVRGFDLRSAPMLRVTLLQWGESSFSLVWSFHHALLDGRSYPVLLREVFEAYAELDGGTISERAKPFAYREYIEWLQEQNFDAAEAFWKEKLAGFKAATPLVVDRQTAEASESYQQGEAWEKIDSRVTAGLRKLAQEHELTLNAIVMGAWATLLHRYSGEDDIVFAATRAARKSSVPNAVETIGLFINTAPVRVGVRDEETLLTVCKEIRKFWVEMRPYEHTPLSRVKAASQVAPSQPLFETLLVFENYRLDTVMHSLGGEWAKREVELHELTNFPITLAAYDGEELSFKIEFDRRRLEDETVGRMLGHLRNLLEGIQGNPDARVGELELVTKAERDEFVNRSAGTAGSRPTKLPLDGGATLHELFEAQAARSPKAIALTCEGVSLTYAEVNAQANVVARRLIEYGVKPETLVGICLDRTNEIVIAILAILKSGGAYLPIDLAYPSERLAFMLEDAQAPVLLTQRDLAPKLPATKAKVLFIHDVLDAGNSNAAETANVKTAAGADNLAYVIYTSGTTGVPKGSLITHRNVARLFSATEHWYEFNEQDTWTLFHSTAFDFSVWEIWGALLYGGRVVVVPFLVSRSPEAFYELLAREKVTVLNQTPSAFRQLMHAEESLGQKDLALRYVIFGGEALEMQSLRPWFERHGDRQPQLVNMYGITETTVHVTYRPLSKDDLGFGSVIGVPIPDLRIYILDGRGHLAPIGVPGEMHVGGAGLARGYLRRPDLTEQRFIPDHVSGRPGSQLYKTGDLARFLAGGDIEYLGRIDHQVKIRGFRIELGEIESVLSQHAAVRAAVVTAREDEPGVKRLVAYVVASRPAPEVSALREHLGKKVPGYMVPAAFVFLDELPLTTNGKVDRKALPVPEQQRPELTGRYVAPRTEAEKKLAAIWSKALRLEQIGINDNFFELGGDSILSIQIISSARREGMQLSPKLLFANQTIAALAAAAGEAGGKEERDKQVVAGEVPLTPIEHWFFEQNLEDAHHYNQGFVFELRERLDGKLLERAVGEVSKQHDALRLRCVREGLGWRQFYSTAAEPAPEVEWVDVADLPEAEQRRTVEAISSERQASLNLQAGPIWRVVYFACGAGRADRLLVVVHHVAVDGISWRPLLEDLETAYGQLKAKQNVELPMKTASYKVWADRLQSFVASGSLKNEVPYWTAVTDAGTTREALKPAKGAVVFEADTEGQAKTEQVELDSVETQNLLRNVPAIYNTQINDVLLTALTRAWNKWTGSRVLFTNLEGHGRENLFEDVDISRTVGWFTTIFPVRLELGGSAEGWEPGEALKSVKEQIRRIPQRGIGYGLLRYLSAEKPLAGRAEPAMVFNYLGQFDQALAGSKLFCFAPESSGAWHSPRQKRRHALEINSLVMNGQMKFDFTYAAAMHSEESVQQFAGEFLNALREIIAHCQQPGAGGRTPSDFPLAGLEQAALDGLLKEQRDVEDIYPLSPMQTLFFSANFGLAQGSFDQWHCTLSGKLDAGSFERAWNETIRRHAVLRSTIASAGLPEPLQVVHREVRAPWTNEDWRNVPAEQQASRWDELLKQDRGEQLDLARAPAMRFKLVQLREDSWKFLWSVPAMLLDGWSWPLVFRDVSLVYESYEMKSVAQLEAVRPYRAYLEWLNAQDAEESGKFWKKQLAGFRKPTMLSGERPAGETGGERYVERVVQVSVEATNALQAVARKLKITLNTLVQGAWTLLLSRQSGETDVVFGAAFSGRPTDLPGAESIVGPFTNNLPVRMSVKQEELTEAFLRKLHSRLLELSAFQFTPLMEIQRSSEVPWRYRIFDSLLVYQNYEVDDAAKRLGRDIQIGDFAGPIHTNYPLLLLAEPGEGLRFTLIYDRKVLTASAMERWAADLVILCEMLPAFLDKQAGELQALLSAKPAHSVEPEKDPAAQWQNFVPAQTEMEKNIAKVWQKMFGLDEVNVEANFFELGGHSLLLVQMHSLLRQELKTDFPMIALFEHPTVRMLAGHLSQPAGSKWQKGEQMRERAQRQKKALAQMRGPNKK